MDLAETFIQEQGFNGFSYAHIAKELDVCYFIGTRRGQEQTRACQTAFRAPCRPPSNPKEEFWISIPSVHSGFGTPVYG